MPDATAGGLELPRLTARPSLLAAELQLQGLAEPAAEKCITLALSGLGQALDVLQAVLRLPGNSMWPADGEPSSMASVLKDLDCAAKRALQALRPASVDQPLLEASSRGSRPPL